MSDNNNNERDFAWVICTYFDESDKSLQDDWQHLQTAILAKHGDFRAYVTFHDDNKNSEPLSVVKTLPDNYPYYFCFIVDRITFEGKDSPILVVSFEPSDDLGEEELKPRDARTIKSFRAIPSTIQCIENNLSIANMDWEDYAENLDSAGIHRGFSN